MTAKPGILASVRRAAAGGGGQITFDSAASIPINSVSHSLGQAAGNDRIVLVATNTEGLGNEVTAVTYDGVSMTKVVDVFVNSRTHVAMWYLLDADLPASAGTYTVTGTSGNSTSFGTISYHGVAQEAPEAAASSGVQSTDTVTTNITTLTDGAWVVDGVGDSVGGTSTPGTGQTERYDSNGSSIGWAGSDKEVATAGATSMAQTLSTSFPRIGHVVCAIAPA